MAKNFKSLILVVAVIITFALLLWAFYWMLNNISPFSKEVNFGIASIVILGFYVGAGFTFKKLKVF